MAEENKDKKETNRQEEGVKNDTSSKEKVQNPDYPLTGLA